MRRLVERYAGTPAHALDYTALLRDTNVFTGGRDLVFDAGAHRRLATLLAEAEAYLDLQAAFRCLAGDPLQEPAEAKVSCDLEVWAFFEPHRFQRVLYVGSGAVPHIAIQALARFPELRVDGVDLVPHCTVLCAQVADRLGLRDRLRAFTGDAGELAPDQLAAYDGFFVSSAVRPKSAIVERLLRHGPPGARVYVREDEAHPQFYEPVEIEHPLVLSARGARARWRAAHGAPYPMPEGCEVPGG